MEACSKLREIKVSNRLEVLPDGWRVLFNDSASHFASCSSGADFGLGIIEELARHGYKLIGTLYPMLHDMERKGYLHEERSGRLDGFTGQTI